jgi:3-hydroxyacyl-[acyl-carrier-protein] dehydratase
LALLTQEEIKGIIPHRDPFLLIDEVLELEPGVRAVAQKRMVPESFWFAGHFPGYPVTPGVLMIEMLAQTGAVCALSLPENKGRLAMFAGIDKARFRREVKPGDLLRLEVEMIRLRGSIGVGRGVATVEGERAVTAELMFTLGPRLGEEAAGK